MSFTALDLPAQEVANGAPTLPAGVHRVLPNVAPALEGTFAERLLAYGRELGFRRLGVTGVDPLSAAAESLRQWLDAGYHGEMRYLEKERAQPRTILREAETLIAVAIAYPGSTQAGETIASYARGLDYHTVLKAKLLSLAQHIANDLQQPLLARPCVDTAPLLERAAAERAGIGVIGKSTLTIVPGVGTYVLLGELLLDVVLPDLAQPLPKSVCGRCTRCIDACPTGAFVAPYVLDARRCISYLTIEHRGVIPREFRQAIGTHVAGCDICQMVCPFNASKKARAYPAEFAALSEPPDLTELLHITTGDYRRWVKHSALSRLSRLQVQRNAAVALGNSKHPNAVPALIAALVSPHALLRSHVAWALGQHGGSEAVAALQRALASEADADVTQELEAALATCVKA